MNKPSLTLSQKRSLLIVDDEEINRDLLCAYLEDEYRIETAVDGIDALDKLSVDPQRFSAILLDILMPRKDGLSVLRELADREDCKGIPVLVLTSEHSLEVEALRLGALDFIKKPYESPEIVQARVWRIVEWYENGKILQQTTLDRETGLYTRAYFRFLLVNVIKETRSAELLAISLPNVEAIAEFYSSSVISDAFKKFVAVLQRFCDENHGFAMQRHEGLFYACLPQGTVYDTFLTELRSVLDDALPSSGIRLKFGVYPCQRDEDVDVAFNRAYKAAELIHDAKVDINVFDEAIHGAMVRQQKLLNDFPVSLKRGDFKVYFQPKYAVQGDHYRLGGAEALIRWFHPELGFISPGEFIPLLENAGRVGELDLFVYENTFRVLERLKKEYQADFPISANASPSEVLNASFLPFLLEQTKARDIYPNSFHMEVIESTFGGSFQRIIDVLGQIRAAGVPIEMDDFGSGYSALGKLTVLPFDYLKIDMSFVRKLFASKHDEAVLRLIIDMAKTLGKKTIAEGAEDERQVSALKEFGCDYVQGYYFSKPLPEEEFFALVAKEYPL